MSSELRSILFERCFEIPAKNTCPSLQMQVRARRYGPTVPAAQFPVRF
jgi:hypothetical protein